MRVLQLECYQTSDGNLFTCDRKAKEHQSDIIGQLLDDFLLNDDRGNITRTDRYNVLTKQLKDPKLADKIKALYHAINFTEE
ncbi:hypothetical protein Barba22A_gp046 [Rheinheimera phage vB_RspM_Barba22A]|jgi:hypothetical protein|uniref:Uncharacterized protein n=83 Tax=Barbavirus TaxID=2733095 RepID=A0A7G9VRR8_9CAUD|nr:hypothetical protein HOV44_gp050 [Rheinheimera phage Barba5S]YP_009822784.1 hypothetical protein HOV45_gp048 [Rheinheimera phage Barba8S]YP_009822923.1 hypothetical protein HOV46_gp046 [Rheinheimera phage vB_RspM_Barba18A]YP_009823202.1 hypothetical protein HOV48_gp046 [Rheinheimera phage Barba21A]QCQ57897.1 hypothetical protein Barba1A_gp046 [Rheinheimera phage vB_RspM_Barba1A]QCQ58033.1 hypothetical protein Barba1S_gp046 [Rheinheimera phage vB_RspM_Barba1S]QCQ58169.1 hypothetical protein